jgi:hypothetical protein
MAEQSRERVGETGQMGIREMNVIELQLADMGFNGHDDVAIVGLANIQENFTSSRQSEKAFGAQVLLPC